MASIEPPIVGQQFGSGNDLDVVVLCNRFEPTLLRPDSEFPVFVYICLPNAQRFVDGVEHRFERTDISHDDLSIIAWGELYRTADDAANHRFD